MLFLEIVSVSTFKRFRKDKMKIFSPSVKLRLAFCLSLTNYCTIKGEKAEMKSNQPSSVSILLSTWGLFLLTVESSELWWCHHQYPYLNIMGGEMPRGVFRTLPNMYDDVLAKILQTLIIFTGAWIWLWMPHPTLLLPISDVPTTPTAVTWLFKNSENVSIYKKKCLSFYSETSE